MQPSRKSVLTVIVTHTVCVRSACSSWRTCLKAIPSYMIRASPLQHCESGICSYTFHVRWCVCSEILSHRNTCLYISMQQSCKSVSLQKQLQQIDCVSFIHSLIHRITQSFIHSVVHSMIPYSFHSFMHLFVSFSLSLFHSINHSLVH